MTTIPGEEARALEVLDAELRKIGRTFGAVDDRDRAAIRAMLAFAHQSPSRAAGPLERFADDVQDVQSRIVIVHQLRASADIQDAATKRETGWADTSDRAQLMRRAADTIEALATPQTVPAENFVLVPRQPSRADFDKLARLWGYNDEETAETLGAILDVFAATPQTVPANAELSGREAAFVAFALRCSAGNPASIGSARNEAVELLERFGIEPRESGVFYHDLAADERNAAAALATPAELPALPSREEMRLEPATPVTTPGSAREVNVPLAFYDWLAGIEKDARVHDLTPDEIAGLKAVLAESEPMPACPDRLAVARAADAILGNLRDRRLLKYLFHEDPESCVPYGHLEAPIDLETQRECAETLARLALAALHPPASVAEVERWRVETLRDSDVPKGAWDWIDSIAKATQPPHRRVETPRDAETIVFWHNEQPVAFVLNIRDQFNRSIQFRASLSTPMPDGEGEQ